MPPYLLASFALLSLLWIHVAQAQNSSAVCTDGYEWASGLPSPQYQLPGLLNIQSRAQR